MQFIYPSFLFALSALIIPVLIHLFNFRRFKKVYFSNVKFLKELKEETQSQSRIKHLLVLLCRILALTFLVLAFAQPFIPKNKNLHVKGTNSVSIFVDNSFSMEAQQTSGSLLDLAKKYAADIVLTYKPGDKFHLVTNDFEPKHQRWVNREEFLELLKEVSISASSRNLVSIITRQRDLLNELTDANKNAFIISDFQKSSYRVEKLQNDTDISYTFVPLEIKQQSNIYIDSCWFSKPVHQLGATEELSVRIKNVSGTAVENLPVKLLINGEEKALGSCNIDAGQETLLKLTYTNKQTGIQQGEIQINDFPISYDNIFYFAYSLVDQIKILCVNSDLESGALNSIFGRDPFFSFQDVSDKNVDYAALPLYNLVILNGLKSLSSGLSQEIKKFVEKGGSCLVIPAKDIDRESYQAFSGTLNIASYTTIDTVDTKVNYINYQSDIYQDVFEKIPENINLPSVWTYYNFSVPPRSTYEALLKTQNGNLFLVKYPVRKGKIYLLNSFLGDDAGNFTRHAIFVPTLYNIALYSINADKIYYTIAKDNIIQLTGITEKSEGVFHITDNKALDFIPEQRSAENGYNLYLHDQPSQAGNYFLMLGDFKKGLAFNFNREESNLSYYTADQLSEALDKNNLSNFSVLSSTEKNISSVLMMEKQGRQLWKYCLLLTLVFMAAEIGLLRFWKS
jgi:hypothetical protein